MVVQNGISHTITPKWHQGKKPKTKGFSSIHDRSLLQESFRHSQMEIGWTEETCSHMDALALEDHSSVALRAERVRYENTWRINLNGQGSNTAPPRQRADV